MCWPVHELGICVCLCPGTDGRPFITAAALDAFLYEHLSHAVRAPLFDHSSPCEHALSVCDAQLICVIYIVITALEVQVPLIFVRETEGLMKIFRRYALL